MEETLYPGPVLAIFFRTFRKHLGFQFYQKAVLGSLESYQGQLSGKIESQDSRAYRVTVSLVAYRVAKDTAGKLFS